MKACEEVEGQFQAYIDGHLGPAIRMCLEFHLSYCGRCSQKLDDFIESKLDSGEIKLLKAPFYPPMDMLSSM